VGEADLEGKNAQYTDPKLAAENFVWADKVLMV
jgi:hypothetical protein